MSKVIPVLIDQGAQPHGGLKYSIDSDPDTIKSSGCGLVAMTMALVVLLGRPVLVRELLYLALKFKDRTANQGTSWAFFKHVADLFKLKCVQTTDLALVLREVIKPNVYVICSMKPPTFTKGGHYILMCDYNMLTKKLTVRDSAGLAGKLRSAKTWSPDVFKKECKQYWIISKDGV